MHVTVVDCGIAEPLSPQQRLLARKIAHGTRNSRAGAAMTVEQAHAGVRVGMEISDNLAGNVIACAGLGQGSLEASALVLSRLMDMPVQDFIISGPDMPHDDLSHLMLVLQGAQQRHREVREPMAVLAGLRRIRTGGDGRGDAGRGVEAAADSWWTACRVRGVEGGVHDRSPGHRLRGVLPQHHPSRTGRGASAVPRGGAAGTRHGMRGWHRRDLGVAAGPLRGGAADGSAGTCPTGPSDSRPSDLRARGSSNTGALHHVRPGPRWGSKTTLRAPTRLDDAPGVHNASRATSRRLLRWGWRCRRRRGASGGKEPGDGGGRHDAVGSRRASMRLHLRNVEIRRRRPCRHPARTAAGGASTTSAARPARDSAGRSPRCRCPGPRHDD